MDIKYLETEKDLKNDLIAFTKKNVPTSKAELELGTKIEYTDKFIEFIVIKSFKELKDLKDFITIMLNLIGERKHQLVLNSSKAADIMFEGHLAEHPLVLDYDEKRGTLLKYHNRTLSKYIETDSVNNVIDSMRNNGQTNTKKPKNK